MIYGPLLFLSIVLFELFVLLRMVDNARSILASSREAMRVLASRDLTDDEKEASVRRGSLEILKATLLLAAKLLLTGAILFALFQLIVRIYPDLRQPLADSLVSPVAIAILTVAIMGYAWARKSVSGRGTKPQKERSQ
jgi:hypothetical protein